MILGGKHTKIITRKVVCSRLGDFNAAIKKSQRANDGTYRYRLALKEVQGLQSTKATKEKKKFLKT